MYAGLFGSLLDVFPAGEVKSKILQVFCMMLPIVGLQPPEAAEPDDFDRRCLRRTSACAGVPHVCRIRLPGRFAPESGQLLLLIVAAT